MKKQFLSLSFPVLIIGLSALVLTACKKDSKSPTTSGTGSFVIDGTTYTEGSSKIENGSVGDANFTSLIVGGSNGTKKGEIAFYFFGASKPKAGTYQIVYDLSNVAAGTVKFLAADSISVSKQRLFSPQSGTVTVSVNAAGKLSVNMPSVAFTGSNIDKTDPSHVVTTDVTSSGSAAVNEN